MIAGEMTERSRHCAGRGESNSCIWGEIIIVREEGANKDVTGVTLTKLEENEFRRTGHAGLTKFSILSMLSFCQEQDVRRVWRSGLDRRTHHEKRRDLTDRQNKKKRGQRTLGDVPMEGRCRKKGSKTEKQNADGEMKERGKGWPAVDNATKWGWHNLPSPVPSICKNHNALCVFLSGAPEHTILLAVNAIWSLCLMRKEKHFKYVLPWRSLLNRLKVSGIGWKK